MNQEAASIMLVDDHPLLRKGLQQLIELSDDLTIVAALLRFREVIQCAE